MTRFWSQHATKTSNALDLEKGVFTWSSPKKIAQSLKQSAESSTRKKAKSYKSAMAMLSFYINRAGKKLPRQQQNILLKAKIELRRLFNR